MKKTQTTIQVHQNLKIQLKKTWKHKIWFHFSFLFFCKKHEKTKKSILGFFAINVCFQDYEDRNDNKMQSKGV